MDAEPDGTTSVNSTTGEKLLSVLYCPVCRNICLREPCEMCRGESVRVWGTLDEFRQLGHIILNSQHSEWRQVIESMIEKQRQ